MTIPDLWAVGDTVYTPDGRGVIKELVTGSWSGKPMVKVNMRNRLRAWWERSNTERWYYINELSRKPYPKGRR